MIDTVKLRLTFFILFLFSFTTLTIAFSGDDDASLKEISIEWVNNYPFPIPDLSMCDDDAQGFYNTLGANGFTRIFEFGDGNAGERDFEKAGVGGRDSSFADNVDFIYFAGHGTPDCFIFGTNTDGDATHTSVVHYSEVELGDKDLEWLFLAACEVLEFESIDDWEDAFDSYLHGMCGFDTIMVDTPDLGTLFAEYLTDIEGPYSIGEAWKRATQADPNQFSWIYAACYRRLNLDGYGDPLYDFWNDKAQGPMGNEHWGSWDFAYTRWSC